MFEIERLSELTPDAERRRVARRSASFWPSKSYREHIISLWELERCQGRQGVGQFPPVTYNLALGDIANLVKNLIGHYICVRETVQESCSFWLLAV